MEILAESEQLWLLPHEQLAWRSFIKLDSLLMSRLDVELVERHGLSLAEYEVLAHLSEAEGRALRMSALADLALVSRSGLTRRLEHLVARGLVIKEICPSDRRGMIARLTKLGQTRLEDAAPTHVAGVRRYLISAFSVGELQQFTALLQAPISELEEAARPGSDCLSSLKGCP